MRAYNYMHMTLISLLLIVVTAAAHWVALEIPSLGGNHHAVLAIAYTFAIAATFKWADTWVISSLHREDATLDKRIRDSVRFGEWYCLLWVVSILVFIAYTGWMLWTSGT